MQKTIILGLALSVLMIACEDYDLKKYEEKNLTEGLIAYYPFNGNANDESGNGNNGTNNGAILTNDRFGNANQAYNFNGTNNYINIPDANAFDFSSEKQFSISCWIKRDSTAGSMVVSKWGASQDDDDEWYISVGSGQLSISVNSTPSYGSPNLDLLAPNYIPQNTWTHIVLIWNGSSTSGYGALYVNGTLVASNSSTITTIANTSEPIRIGSYGHSNGYYKGISDDFRIYKRAINESEIQALYHEGGWTGNPSGTVTDIDGNVYHTVQIGTQTWMVENLKTTRYRNGDPIPNVTDAGTWSGLTTGAYCYYNNNSSYNTDYGKLYNWYAVNDSRNIAPVGWHVASDAEWTTLTNYLGGSNIAGGKLKEAGTLHWATPNTGADNSSGFTALPGGYRNYYNDGAF